MLIRPAEPADVMAVAGVHVRSWQSGYRSLIPDDILDAMRPEDRAARYTFGDPSPDAPRTQLAVVDDAIVGFVTISPSQAVVESGEGTVFALYVDPDSWGTGVGQALMAAARDRLRQDGASRAVLWVLAGNERAQRFYRADGWISDGITQREELWGVTVDELRYSTAL